MNDFFLQNFIISKINFAMLVNPRRAKLVHTNRAYHGLVFFKNGKNLYRFQSGEELFVTAGDLLYLPEGSSYIVTQIERGDCLAVNFELLSPDETYPPFSLSPAYSTQFEELFTSLVRLWASNLTGYLNGCMQKLYELICLVQKEGMKRYLPSKHRKIALEGAKKLQDGLPDPDLSIAKIAAEFAITPEYFRRLFKSVLGVSPKRYLLQLRISKAKALLLEGGLSIGEIAAACGYEDTSYFCKEFKKFVRCTPTEFNG